MSYRKIRGHKRRQVQIPKWIKHDTLIDFDHLVRNGYWYAKILVYPWCNISITNSKIPEPKSKTRDQLMHGLEKIYDAWKIQLEKLNEPYYLKIWLYEPNFSRSQVVCGIRERIERYEDLFEPIDIPRRASDFYNKLSPDFKWESFEEAEIWGENHLLDGPDEGSKYYKEGLAFISQLKKAGFRTLKIETEEGEDILYIKRRGTVWVGGK